MSRLGIALTVVMLSAALVRAEGLEDASTKLRNLAAAGEFKRANDLAKETSQKYGMTADPVALARFDLLHARLLIFTRYGESAIDDIERAEKVAETHDDALLKADIAYARAKYLTGQKKYDEALMKYDDAIAAFDAAGDKSARADAIADALTTALGAAKSPGTYRVQASDALKQTDLPDIAKRKLLIAMADSDKADPAKASNEWLALAKESEQLNDPRTAALAWSRVAAIYETGKKPEDALYAARKGLFSAQRAGADDIKFALDWQIARLQKSAKPDQSIDSYFRSIRSLQNVRHDLLIHLSRSGAPGTFRQNIGPVYYQLADMLIKRSEGKSDDGQQEDLKLARQVIEQLKTVELEDYFQDQCVNLAKEQERIVDLDLQQTAVVYLIPLADRTEILISTPGGRIERVTSSATDSQISQAARQFRYDATNRRNNKYLTSGKQIYDAVIAPMLPVLEKSDASGAPIKTLVFVPDGDLRMVPMAALWDGEKFLVERFAIAISPGLTLMRPEPLDRAGRQLQVLKAGVTVERTVGKTVFAALPNVSNELDQIQKLYPGMVLKDQDFRSNRLETDLEQNAFRIVHIASHGQFKADARDTFILTYDSTLSLDQLERLMLPSKFRDEPIELLTLSACQTAAGDDGARAALGMAGIAVKAGARSAMATLWFVSDEASSELVAEFYKQLQGNPMLSRSEALQRAQLHVLQIDRFRHPYYWAPFLMIGNWK